MPETIEIDLYICGVYQGRHQVGKNSICGKLASGDYRSAFQDIKAMKNELERLGCIVKIRPNDGLAEDK